jgi:Ca2+/Na+ antiporter
MVIIEHVELFIVLALTLAGCGFVTRTCSALKIADQRFLIGTAALAFVGQRPLYDVTVRNFLRRTHQTVSAARAFLSTPMFQQIVVFGIIAFISSPAESYELAVGSSILLCCCLALVFLFFGLLYAGTEKIMSARFIDFSTYEPFSPTESDPPCGDHDVEPPRPRFILA